MARQFLPALRRRLSTTALEAPPERKTIYLGNGFTSLTHSGSMRFGLEDRAAGWDMNAVITEGYERVVWVFRCVELIAGHASRLPFRIGRDLDGDNKEILEDHPLYRVMNKRANPLETGRQFRKRLSAQVLLSKRGAFVEVTKSRAGTITRLDLLPPDRVLPVPDPHGDYISHFEFVQRDGGLRKIPPERIRWIRDPHPTDPFCGITPLEAAGVSVELDHLSRLYNVSFIKNDGRPGGIVAVDADVLDDDEMERIEGKFAPGAQHAGQIKVIGVGPGGMNYVDVATRPRDMAYEHASQNAKQEILSAFGIGESVLGNAAGRTFDNAEQELYNFWTEVMLPHLDLIASAFDQDVDEEWDPFIDTSSVEVLELPRRRKREEARQEWQAGLRSIDEYRPLADLEPLDNAYSRALWISPSKAPVPARPEDAEALGLHGPGGSPVGSQGQPGGGPEGGMPPEGGPGTPAPGGTAADAVAEARGETNTGAGSAAEAVAQARQEAGGGQPGEAAAAVQQARQGTGGGQPGEAAAAVQQAHNQTETKAAPGGIEVKAVDPPQPPGVVEYDPGEDELRRAEIAIAGALDALL
ncbi:phage portal protein, partial [Carbonactinospora thermoautotrophica]